VYATATSLPVVGYEAEAQATMLYEPVIVQAYAHSFEVGPFVFSSTRRKICIRREHHLKTVFHHWLLPLLLTKK
jgi:hypothetical protein